MGGGSAPRRIRVGAVVGPTAVGKSELALALAEALGAEILSADSTAVYRGMDIGTDKPSPEARRRVPHHLLDLADPDETFTAALYKKAADGAIREIAARGGRPLLVGGSGLHVRAVLQGYQFSAGAPDPEERRKWNELLAERGVAALARILKERAPDVAARTDLRNPRRVIRALERLATGAEEPRAGEARTGEAGAGEARAGEPGADPSGRRSRPDEPRAPYDALVVGLHRERDALHRRIAERVDRELRDGLVDEVRGLLDAGHPPDAVAFRALGYKEVIGHLQGEYDAQTMRGILIRNTRRFARRQYTWFRREPGIVWLDLDEAGEAALPTLVAWFEAFYERGERPKVLRATGDGANPGQDGLHRPVVPPPDALDK